MRFRLRTLLILLAVLPPILAVIAPPLARLSDSHRERRRAELKALLLHDRVALLKIYQQGADLDQLANRPGGVTFAEMIAAILEREGSHGNAAPEA